MKINGKKAIFAGAAGVVLGGTALLIGKMLCKKKEDEWSDEVIELAMGTEEEGEVDIEFTMSAGEIDLEEDAGETELEAAEETEERELPEVKVTNVIPAGPKTARVRPTEEEEKEILRKKLERTIRF